MLIHADAKRDCPYWSSYREIALTDPAMFSAIGGASSVTLFSSFCWEADGEQTFLLGADQCRMFREMDLSGITPNDIRYPFDSFYICLEGSGLKLRASLPTEIEEVGFEEPSDPEHSVQGVYVTRRSSLQAGARVRGGMVREMIGMGNDGRLLGDTLTIVAWAHNKSARISDDIMFGYSLEDSKVLESMDFESAILSILHGERRDDRHCTANEEEFNRVTALEISRIVVGMCAYLECRQAVVVEKDFSADRKRLERIIKNGGKKAAKAERMLTRIPTAVIRIIDPNLRYLGQDKVAVKAHWRRAHTRLQWVGSKRDDDGNARLGTHRERRWIPSTIVNADGGTPEPKTYILD
jgi:hypothetical protein